MKKLLNTIFFLSLCTIAFFSCTEDGQEPAPEDTRDLIRINFNYYFPTGDGSTAYIVITDTLGNILASGE